MTQNEFVIELNENDVKEFAEEFRHQIVISEINILDYLTGVHEFNGRVAFWFEEKSDSNDRGKLHTAVRKIHNGMSSIFIDCHDGHKMILRRNDDSKVISKLVTVGNAKHFRFDEFCYSYDNIFEYLSRALGI